ncbi:hypothetical protein CAEBREN_11090 [Caenorhabditis brenneri]|uniref:Domain of unknown function WSN domain-containing protein n=1 Tax=Caenorhabditis brenneri TaxID=135651 RepID=G0N6M9_CAEBE|nr:hypothetical protein CAEBREN_11090 [Caenorhabditis brenneri]
MVTILFLCLCLGINVLGEDISNAIATSTSISNNINSGNFSSSPTPTGVDEELTKIATTCLSPQDYELLTGNSNRYHVVGMIIYPLIQESVTIIGLQELRTVLKLPSHVPWKNETEPSEHELASAATIEEYYNLKEPRSIMRSPESPYFFEHNIDTAITYLNKRLPTIRTIYKKTFEEVSVSEVLDKKEIERMIQLLNSTNDKIDKATSKMIRNSRKCWDKSYW